jgi:hypothetical protein
MKIKRKEIINSINNHISLMQRNINQHEQDRAAFVKSQQDDQAAYHWGRISGLTDSIVVLEIIKDQLGIR